MQPDIEGRIVAFEVEGQVRSRVNAAGRTVTVELAEGVDAGAVRVAVLTLNDGATADVEVGDVVDLRAPLVVTVTTLADYAWTVSATHADDGERALPGGDFDEWNVSGTRTWNPWRQGAVWEVDRWWDTGNRGVTLLADSNSVPTDPGEGCPADPSGRAARLETTWAAIKAAGGNIYFGQFGQLTGLDATCLMGHNWQSKPKSLRGWYKYFPQPVDRVDDKYLPLHPYGLSRDEWMGSPDSLSVIAALWASPDGRDIPFTVDTTPSRFVDFLASTPGVIAFGQLVSAGEQAEWSEFEVEMEYFTDEPLPPNTHLIVQATASKNCNYFIAGTGSVAGTAGSLLYVDEFELVY